MNGITTVQVHASARNCTQVSGRKVSRQGKIQARDGFIAKGEKFKKVQKAPFAQLVSYRLETLFLIMYRGSLFVRLSPPASSLLPVRFFSRIKTARSKDESYLFTSKSNLQVVGGFSCSSARPCIFSARSGPSPWCCRVSTARGTGAASGRRCRCGDPRRAG